MRVELADVPEPPIWPAGTHVRAFTEADAARVHALLEQGYEAGGGAVSPFEEWRETMLADAEYDPALWFLAEADDLVGVCLCWTSGWVKDLVVAPAWRRRGLGEALLRHAFGAFRARGLAAAELKVHADNPSGAYRLYERLGMRIVEITTG